AMCALLQPHGVAIATAADEQEADAALARADAAADPLHLLISDLRLRDGEDGLQTCARLRARWDPTLPVLLITGETSDGQLQSVRAAGWPVLHKPVAFAALAQALTVHARRAAVFSAAP